MLRFSQQNGAKNITLKGRFVTEEGAAFGGGKLGETFSHTFPATKEGLQNFITSLK